MLLPDLLTLAEISNWNRAFWFKGAQLKGDVLVVVDESARSFITNCWLPKMRETLPTLRVIVASEQPVSPKPVTERKGIWKAGKEPRNSRLGGLE